MYYCTQFISNTYSIAALYQFNIIATMRVESATLFFFDRPCAVRFCGLPAFWQLSAFTYQFMYYIPYN